MSDIPEVIFKPRVMAALLVNIMAHDVTHDYNGGSSSTKRLVKLKKRIAELFRLPQEEEPPEDKSLPQATPVPRPRAPKGKLVAAVPLAEVEQAPDFGLVLQTGKNQMDVGTPVTPHTGEQRYYPMDENQRTPFMLKHLAESEASEPQALKGKRGRDDEEEQQGKRRRGESGAPEPSSNVDPLDRPPTEEERENMTDVESRHSDDFVNSLGNWLGRVGRNLGRVTRAAAVSLDNLRQELEEATMYLLGEMAPRQGGGADVIVDRHLSGDALGWPSGPVERPSGPVKQLSVLERYLKKRALDEQWEKEQAQREQEAMDEDTDEDTDEDQGKVTLDDPSPSVSGEAPVKKQVPVEYLNQYNFIAGALASPVRIFLDPEDPEDPEEPSMAEEALQIRQMMADIFHSLCESNPGIPPITLYTSLTYRTLIAFSLVTDDYKRPHEEQEIRGLFSSTGGAVRDQMSQQRPLVAQAEQQRPMAAGSGPADATYVAYINDVSGKLNKYTIESTVKATRNQETGGPKDKAEIEEYLNGIMNELLPSDKSMKPPTSAPNKVTAASYARMLGSKRANPTDVRMKMVYDEFLGKFATNVAAQKANNDIQLDRYEAALERVQLGKDLSPQARGVVNGLSRAVIEGVLGQLPRKPPGNEATRMEIGFHDLQYGIMEGARDTGSTSTIDENLYNGFIKLLKNDPALLTREAALELAQTAREKALKNEVSDPLYKSFDTVNNASDLSHLYKNDPAALLGEDKDYYTACTGASVADAMSYCSYTKAKDDKNLVLHDMVFQLGANNTGLNYTGYSTQAKKKKDVYSVGFHIYVNEDFVVGPTFKNVNLTTGKELSASSVYANVLNHLGTKMSWVASPEDVAAAFETKSILAEFLACICFKNTGDLFQEMNALLRYRGVNDPERRSLVDPFMMFVGNDRPSSVRGMAMARMHEPGSAVNKNALMGYVSSGTQQFVRALGTQGGARVSPQGGARVSPQGGTNAKGNAKATRKSILKRSKNKTRTRKKVRFTLRKSA